MMRSKYLMFLLPCSSVTADNFSAVKRIEIKHVYRQSKITELRFIKITVSQLGDAFIRTSHFSEWLFTQTIILIVLRVEC